MLVLFAFCTRDQDRALDLGHWLNELGGCRGHSAIVLHDKRCDKAQVDKVRSEFVQAFDDVYFKQAGACIDGWPEGANYFFRVLTAHVQDNKVRYFFWLEPDAVPLQGAWLDRIEAEFKLANKPFMGDRVEVADIPLHMSGIGVYPNPLYDFAGEAYRAAEIAWDMAGRDQIIHRAHWTKLIEHAWKHPSFSDISELTTQIRPEAVIFHSSKDGSLIRLLRQKRGGSLHPTQAVIPEQKEPVPSVHVPGSPSPLHFGNTMCFDPNPPREITCDIFIRTYPADYKWLAYCLDAIQKYARGFRKISIVSPEEPTPGLVPTDSDFMWACSSKPCIDWLIRNEESEDGYLSQQIHKLYADVITDYQADYILHIDSDVILTQEIRPEDFFKDGKVIWLFTPYADIQTPWQPVTEKFMRQPVEFEFMRRFPIMVPRWLYAKLREFCYQQHKRIISEYIRTQPPRAFSEFNALGAFAHQFYEHAFSWYDTRGTPLPPPVARQFHSWDGITIEVEHEIKRILSGKGEEPDEQGSVEGIVPEDDSERAKAKPDTAHINTSTEPPPGVKVGIKELFKEIWVLEDDTHVSRWIEEEGRLDHDQNFLPKILPHIKPGAIVIDAGAFIGDHTVAYAKAVGEEGMVYAIEPNPLAIKCLVHNVEGNVTPIEVALSDHSGDKISLSGNNHNAAGAYVGDHMKIADVHTVKLDDLDIKPDFIKLDVEGYELKALKGARKTIREHRPIMVIEVNEVALARQGTTPLALMQWLEREDYRISILQENCSYNSPMYDILCVPAVNRPGTDLAPTPERIEEEDSTPSPQVQMQLHAKALGDYAAANFSQRMQVVHQLHKYGLVKFKGKHGKPKKK